MALTDYITGLTGILLVLAGVGFATWESITRDKSARAVLKEVTKLNRRRRTSRVVTVDAIVKALDREQIYLISLAILFFGIALLIISF
jgi:hypothetical protein